MEKRLPLHADLYFKEVLQSKQQEKKQGIMIDVLTKKARGLVGRTEQVLDIFGLKKIKDTKTGRLVSFVTPDIKTRVKKEDVIFRIHDNVSDFNYLIEAKTEDSKEYFTLFTLVSMPVETAKNWRGNEATMEEMKTIGDFLDFIEEVLLEEKNKEASQKK
jgi:hypothetical protein